MMKSDGLFKVNVSLEMRQPGDRRQEKTYSFWRSFYYDPEIAVAENIDQYLSSVGMQVTQSRLIGRKAGQNPEEGNCGLAFFVMSADEFELTDAVDVKQYLYDGAILQLRKRTQSDDKGALMSQLMQEAEAHNSNENLSPQPAEKIFFVPMLGENATTCDWTNHYKCPDVSDLLD